MDVGDFSVTLPFSRLVAIATLAGMPDHDLCPPYVNRCWYQRGLTPYLPVDPDDPYANECAECFLHYFVTGE